MRVTTNSGNLLLSHTTQTLLQRMLSPLCGLDQRLGFMLRGQQQPRFMVAGAELTGVHVLLNHSKPGSYHIGGTGIILEEAVIRSLGETIERYSQFVAETSKHHNIVMASYNEMISRGERIIAPRQMQFFSKEQYARPGFPFRPFSPDTPMGWVKAASLVADTTIWIPAQLVFVGYTIKHQAGEKWMLSAFTTGSAAHTSQMLAARNALLELIQIDSAMGHWYSSATAPRIALDARTVAIERLIEQQFYRQRPMPEFYWLPNPDLPGMTVACVIREVEGNLPAVAIGLGIDCKLVKSMYKALLECVGVMHLAKIALVNHNQSERPEIDGEIDPTQIFDLDENVAFYALPRNGAFIDSKFSRHQVIRASELPADSNLPVGDEIRMLVDGFRNTHKELVWIDLTTEDIRDLGFSALRVWSPDTISLSLPSIPPLSHPRFEAYGGAYHEHPHPYP